ncbi:MAG TPA: PEP-utilizing enzyme [Thermomicrobiales bacterium]|nr:PEP-utilizing enzyme [Thermomicrobiales bacterium]
MPTGSPTRIPLPPGLVPAWETPEDEDVCWRRDPMHSPGPITMMDADANRATHEGGFSVAAQRLGLPVRAMSRRFWTHLYVSHAPPPLPPFELEAMGRRAEEDMPRHVANLWARWETEWLPVVQEMVAFWERFDLDAATLPALVEHFDTTLALYDRLWTIHFEIAFPLLIGPSMFEEMYRDLFGADTGLEAFKLLQGFDNKTVQSGRRLRELALEIRALPDARAIVDSASPADIIPAMRQSLACAPIVARIDDYLREFGKRGHTWGLSPRPWIDDPTPVIKNLKDYVNQPGIDPATELATLAGERDAMIAAARERLAAYPEGIRQQFEFLLEAAQRSAVVQEDHNFWIDFRATYEVRRVMVELGRRFTSAGLLDDPEDIFHLRFSEARETAAQFPALSRRALVADRKAEMRRYEGVPLPMEIGSFPPGPPPDDIMMRTTAKFFGSPPPAPEQPGELRGAPGAAGVVRGLARVVRTLADAGKVEPGDVLVAETTAPPWTPLFATVAAVVTDTGGVLSHCAIVAREYRIPAVVGAGMATAVIRDGMLVEVDGTRGVVTILGE